MDSFIHNEHGVWCPHCGECVSGAEDFANCPTCGFPDDIDAMADYHCGDWEDE